MEQDGILRADWHSALAGESRRRAGPPTSLAKVNGREIHSRSASSKLNPASLNSSRKREFSKWPDSFEFRHPTNAAKIRALDKPFTTFQENFHSGLSASLSITYPYSPSPPKHPSPARHPILHLKVRLASKRNREKLQETLFMKIDSSPHQPPLAGKTPPKERLLPAARPYFYRRDRIALRTPLFPAKRPRFSTLGLDRQTIQFPGHHRSNFIFKSHPKPPTAPESIVYRPTRRCVCVLKSTIAFWPFSPAR